MPDLTANISLVCVRLSTAYSLPLPVRAVCACICFMPSWPLWDPQGDKRQIKARGLCKILKVDWVLATEDVVLGPTASSVPSPGSCLRMYFLRSKISRLRLWTLKCENPWVRVFNSSSYPHCGDQFPVWHQITSSYTVTWYNRSNYISIKLRQTKQSFPGGVCFGL